MRYTVVTMSRGDRHKITEWIDYHAALGFEDFQIVLDGDVDGSEDHLRSTPFGAEITVHRREEVGEYYDGLAFEERRHRVAAWREAHAAELATGRMRGNDSLSARQYLHLPAIMAPYAEGRRGRGWLTLIDVDEFLVLPQHDSVAALTSETTAPRLRILNFNVDTRGHDPTRPVLEQHTMRWSREDVLAYPDQRWGRRVKSMVRNRCATLNRTVHKINRGPHQVLDPATARLHHFKVPTQTEIDIPYSVHDPVPRLSARPR